MAILGVYWTAPLALRHQFVRVLSDSGSYALVVRVSVRTGVL